MRQLTPLFVLLLFPSGIFANESEIPLVGRPAFLPFSEASARFAIGPNREFQAPFAITTSASPTKILPRSQITFSLTVQALGPVLIPPSRVDLRDVPEFHRLFYIEDVIQEDKGQTGPKSWRYRYRLTPRSAEVDEIPGFPFVFYNPDMRPTDRAFQVLYSDPIPLHQDSPHSTMGPAEVSEDLPLASATSIFAARPSWAGPDAISWTMTIAAPVFICAICYLAWRRMYPDAAQRAARRRSLALRQALTAINHAGSTPTREQAEQLNTALVNYLQARFNLGPREPTPEEVLLHLSRFGLSEQITQSTASLLADCARSRFGPSPDTTLAERIRCLILELEEAP